MPIPVQQFPILSPQQANPLGIGLTTGQNLYQQGINNRSLAQANQQALQGQALANALAQLKLNLAPQTLEADLAYKQAQVPYLQANTQKLNQETQLAPLASLIKVQQTNQSGSRFGGAYQLAKALSELSPPVRTAWIAEHQDAYNQMLSNLGNKDNPTLLTPNVVKQFLPVINGNMDNLSLSHPSISPRSFQAPTDTLNEQLKRLGQLQANQYLTTTATRRQAEGGQQLAMMINDPQFNEIVNSASIYAGAAGKGKAFLAQLSQSNPKAYEDYRALKQIYMPLVESAIKRLDQLGASNSQREMLKNMFDKTADEWSANPSQFILQFHNLTHAINLVEKSVNASATPAYNVSRKLNNTVTRNGITYEKRADGTWYPL